MQTFLFLVLLHVRRFCLITQLHYTHIHIHTHTNTLAFCLFRSHTVFFQPSISTRKSNRLLRSNVIRSLILPKFIPVTFILIYSATCMGLQFPTVPHNFLSFFFSTPSFSCVLTAHWYFPEAQELITITLWQLFLFHSHHFAWNIMK